jgi:A/G-specific adenine glycosylase
MLSTTQITTKLQESDFTDILLDWFSKEGRSFPWRNDVSAYRIAVAEALLQKTSAVNALPVFQTFILKYPTVQTLAVANSEEVAADLQSLGLPRRARLLHQLANEIVSMHGGRFPETESALRKLPGVGPYGAAAIASLAFGSRLPMIDINVMRIFERISQIKATPRSGPSKFLREVLLAILPQGKEASFNLALLDFGALVCRSRAPLCSDCPVSHICSHYAATKNA